MKRILIAFFMMSCMLMLNKSAMAQHWTVTSDLTTQVTINNTQYPEGSFHVSLVQQGFNSNNWNVNVSWYKDISPIVGAYVNNISLEVMNNYQTSSYLSNSSFSGSTNILWDQTTSGNSQVLATTNTSNLALQNDLAPLPVMQNYSFTGTFQTTQPLSADDWLSFTIHNTGSAAIQGDLGQSSSFGLFPAVGVYAPESPSITLMLLGVLPLVLVLWGRKKGMRFNIPFSTA